LAYFMDYGIDIILLAIDLGLCYLIYKLYFYLSITKYVKRINKAITENNYSYAKELLSYALKKQPHKKPFIKLKVVLENKV